MSSRRGVPARTLYGVHGAALAISILNAALALAVCVGLIARHRVVACFSFYAYVVFAVALRLIVWTWPDLYAWSYWGVAAAIHTALRIAVAWELAEKAFGPLPRARSRARGANLALLVVFAAVVVAAAKPAAPAAALEWACRLIAYAGALSFAALLALSRYHRVPLDPFHRDVAAGFLVWSLVAGLGQQLAPFDGVVGICRQVIASLLYPGVLVAWAVAAWRADQPTRLRPANLALLRPWRVAA